MYQYRNIEKYIHKMSINEAQWSKTVKKCYVLKQNQWNYVTQIPGF